MPVITYTDWALTRCPDVHNCPLLEVSASSASSCVLSTARDGTWGRSQYDKGKDGPTCYHMGQQHHGDSLLAANCAQGVQLGQDPPGEGITRQWYGTRHQQLSGVGN